MLLKLFTLCTRRVKHLLFRCFMLFVSFQCTFLCERQKFTSFLIDRKGTRFHESKGKHYNDGYGEGDTLGFLIVLPNAHDASHIPKTYKDRVSATFP